MALAACGGARWRKKARLDSLWNLKAAESVVFPLQGREREFSGIAADGESLYLVSENRGKLLKLSFPVGLSSKYEENKLWLREGGEYEGAALRGGYLYLVDEHADPEAGVSPMIVKFALDKPEEPVATYPLRWTELDCRSGLCVEGLAIVGDTVYVLDERDELPGGGCVGRIYVTDLASLESGKGSPARVDLPLPDCDWRYTCLDSTVVNERTYLLTLRKRCVWNSETEECDNDEFVVEMLDLAASQPVVSSYRFPESNVVWWRLAKVARNLEGITVGPDGDLYLVSDNRWFQDRRPKTLLLHIPHID